MRRSDMKITASRIKKRSVQQSMNSKLLIASTIVLGVLAAVAAEEKSPAPVLTESGLVIGSTIQGTKEFLGIPYAAPPVGSRRWRPPAPYGSFPGSSFQATQFGSSCTQPDGSGTEDCLFLNIYTPVAEAD